MSIYAISDLHLSLGADKPMDIFGGRWINYMETLRTEWEKTVSANDYIVIPGDISWATYLEQSLPDFAFIDALPGHKIISKGNHDYWWTTKNKLDNFISANNLTAISFLHNNSIRLGDMVLCGTRGWKCPGDDGFSDEDSRLYNRELVRFDLSLKSAGEFDGADVIAVLHFPPFNARREESGFIKLMKKYGVRRCIYGHLHGDAFKYALVGERDGIDFKLVSADYLNFIPVKI